MFTFTAQRSNRESKASFFCHFILISSLVFCLSAEKKCRFSLKLFDMLLSCFNPFFLTLIPSLIHRERPVTFNATDFLAYLSKLNLLQLFLPNLTCIWITKPVKPMFCRAIIKLTQKKDFCKHTSLRFQKKCD